MMYYKYYITKLSNKNSCKMQVSSYLLNTLNNIEPYSGYIFHNSITLNDNISYIFVYNKEYKELTYDYFFINDIESLNINLKLLNKGNFTIRLFIDERIFNIKFNIDSSLNQRCSFNSQICKLSLNVINNNDNEEDLFIKIFISTINTDGEHKNYWIYIIIIIIISLLFLSAFTIRKKCSDKKSLKKFEEKMELQEIDF